MALTTGGGRPRRGPAAELRAMVLAAGMGSRLGALSDERPKPLLPVCDVPLVRYGLAQLAGHGVTEAAVNLFHRGDLIAAELGDVAHGVAIRYSREADLLGTGGGIARVGDFLSRGGEAPFLVLNGKVVIDVDLDALVALHLRTGAVATMVVLPAADAEQWGAIDVALDGPSAGLVTRILGEAAPGALLPTGSRLRGMFTGVHVLSPRLLARLPREGPSCVIRQGYLPSLREGDRISALVYDGYFQEHSTPARYLAGNFALLAGQDLRHRPGPLAGVDPTARLGRDVVLHLPVRIGEDATIGAGAIIGPSSVVGRGSRVAPGAELRRTIVWPGAEVAGAWDGAIVTPQGAVTVPLAPSSS